MVAPSPILDPSVPQWMRRYALSAASVFRTFWPDKPDRLWSVEFADLPPASKWPGSLVWVSDKNKVGFSNGTAWTDPSGGAL